MIAAPYAALVLDREHGYSYTLTPSVQVFDLRTGSLQRRLGGESTTYCYSLKYECVPKEFGPLVLDSDGLAAVHVRAIYPIGYLSQGLVQVACPTASGLCVALDDEARALSSTDPSGDVTGWSAPVPGVRRHAHRPELPVDEALPHHAV